MGLINQLKTRESQIAPLLATIMHPYCWLFWEFIVDLPMFQHDLLTSLKKAKDKVASLPGGEEALGALEELGSIIVQGPKRKAMEFPPEGRYSFRSEGAGNKQLGAQMRQKRLEKAAKAEKAEKAQKAEKAEEGEVREEKPRQKKGKENAHTAKSSRSRMRRTWSP